MDPVGPWSAYAASYNRLANVGGFQNPPSSDLHHHMGGGVQTAPSSQLLAAHATSGLTSSSASPYNPAGFLSPPPVGYDAVFPPLFHQKAHYSIQHRPLKQPEADLYNQMGPNNFYDQNNTSLAWSQNNTQLPSPFGILPHESVVPNSSVSAKTYENFNAHFAAAQSLNQLNSQISDYRSTPFIDPKKRPTSPLTKTTSSTPFFPQTFVSSEPNVNFRQNDYPAKNFHNGNLQQACNIPSAVSQAKEHRIPQPVRPHFPQRFEKSNFMPPKHNVSKIPNKIYENEKRGEQDSQSSPISFAMMDTQRSYQNTKIRNQQFQNIPNQQNYRFPMTPESDYQRSKSTESFGSTSSNPDCNIGLPRRPSPLHAHTSPNNDPSPVYHMYNSPLTTISSPSPVQPESCFNKHNDLPPPLDASISRSNMTYPTVISKTDVRYERQDYKQGWDDRQRRYPGYESTNGHNRQQYFDLAHQVSLQDLSSCRGDPMSLVKTLQQHQPEKVLDEKSKKRNNKSIEKSSDTDYFVRIPPPAHHNGNQLNQNGYYDAERWNLPPAGSKTYPSSPVSLGTQSTVNQPQSLMVPHPGLPLPYFPSLPYVAPSQSNEEAPNTPVETVKPKVIVPNIVEELRCLLENNNQIEDLRPKKKFRPNPNKSFISSFIRFLHGEKDSSPPPNLRPVRKFIEPKFCELAEAKAGETSNEVKTAFPEFPSDPQDDPRYFPLPKSTDKRSFDSSDSEDSFSFDSKLEKKVEIPPISPPIAKESPQLKESNKLKIESNKKKKRKKYSKRKIKKVKIEDTTGISLPRRVSSLRKAKELAAPILVDDELDSYIPELHGSDSDPAWVPSEKAVGDKKKVRKTNPWKKSKYKIINIDSSDNDDTPLLERSSRKKKKKVNGHTNVKEKTAKPQIISPAKPSHLSSSKSNQLFFNIGEFVVLKTDLHLRNPPLWRVKEKTMLQKFLHCVNNGRPFYKDLPCYTGWSPESKHVYEGVTVKLLSTSKHETVVELLSTDIQELKLEERNDIDNSMERTLRYQDNFEVYVQTLFSQALDSNFLTEIFHEEDDYFLTNVRAMDDFVASLTKKLIKVLDWNEKLISSIEQYSSYKSYPRNGTICQCGTAGSSQLIIYGTPYNKDTLQPSNEPISSMEAPICRDCLSKVEVLHSLCHFKCFLYVTCEERVKEKREAEPNKDTTVVLNDLLADDVWLSQVFKRIREDWGFSELMIEKCRKQLPDIP